MNSKTPDRSDPDAAPPELTEKNGLLIVIGELEHGEQIPDHRALLDEILDRHLPDPS